MALYTLNFEDKRATVYITNYWTPCTSGTRSGRDQGQGRSGRVKWVWSELGGQWKGVLYVGSWSAACWLVVVETVSSGRRRLFKVSVEVVVLNTPRSGLVTARVSVTRSNITRPSASSSYSLMMMMIS